MRERLSSRQTGRGGTRRKGKKGKRTKKERKEKEKKRKRDHWVMVQPLEAIGRKVLAYD
jgi:hypothetical protein